MFTFFLAGYSIGLPLEIVMKLSSLDFVAITMNSHVKRQYNGFLQKGMYNSGKSRDHFLTYETMVLLGISPDYLFRYFHRAFF